MAVKIGAMINLKDKFSSNLNKIAKNSEKEINTIRKSFNRLKKNIGDLGKKIVLGLGVAVGASVKYISESVKAYEVQNRATVSLTNSLKKQKGMTDEIIKSTLAHSGVVQSQGVIGDEVLQMGMNELALYGLKAEQIKKLTGSLGDMLVKEKGLNATVEDSMMAGKVIVKALSGKTKGLQNYGISLDETEQKTFKLLNTEKKIEFLNNKIKNSIGGMNKEMLKTPEGIKQALKNSIGDINETIGEKAIPLITKIFTKLYEAMNKLKPRISSVIDKIGEIEPVISNLITKGIDLMIVIIDKLIDSVAWLSKNWSWIKPLAISIVSIVAAFKTFAIVMGIVNTVMAVFSVVSALGLTPVLALVSVIAIFSVAIYILYKNFDKVKLKASELWEQFKDTKVFKVIKNLLDGYISVFKTIWSWIEKIMGGFSNMMNAVPNLVGKIPLIGRFFKIEKPKANAMGTRYFSGGLTSINERGGELINLPSGSQIIPHDLSKKIVNNKNHNSNITININGSNKDSKAIAYEVASIINRQLGLQGGNVLG